MKQLTVLPRLYVNYFSRIITTWGRQSTDRIFKAYNGLFIDQCIYCLDNLQNANQANICLDCQNQLPRLGLHCPSCGEGNHHGQLCGHCLSTPPYFDEVICPFEYKPPIKQLIHHWKDHGQDTAIPFLTEELMQLLKQHQFDGIIPVPYHWHKLLKRGHNPVRLLCRLINHKNQVPLIDAIQRIQKGSDQQGLSRKERLNNLKKSFAIQDAEVHLIKGKNLLLVDDVLTTGSTCNHISKLLKNAGAKSITVACLARTPAKN